MAHPPLPVAPVAPRHACGTCTGILARLPNGTAPVCPNGGVMAQAPPTATVTGCLHDVANFRQFAGRSKRHFVPRTGRGKFDCSYDPNTGNLDIIVKLNLATTSTWFGEGFSADELLAIRNDFMQNVPAFWNGKWQFSCRKAGFGALLPVTPRFRIEFDSALGAHFKLVIAVPDRAAAQSTAPGLRNCRGFVSINQIVTNDPTVQDRVELLDFHVQNFQHSIVAQMIAQYERRRLEEALKAVGTAATVGKDQWIFVAFDALGDPERLRLRDFARTGATERVAGAYKPPLIVGGVALGTDGPTAGRDRALALAGVITAAGLDNPVQHVPTIVGGQAGARIRIDTAYEDTVAAITYNVAAHEFGHMLGLPDEYENPQASDKEDDNAKVIAKTNYLKLVATAGQRPPVFPSRTVSMMSYGMTIQSFHTVTIWDALCYLTDNIIRPADWEIRML